MASPKEPGHRVTLRLNDDLYASVLKLAKAERRPIAAWLKLAIQDAVDAREAPPAPPKRR